jgi:adenylate cyclase class 2
MSVVEIELKFPVDDGAALEVRLLAIGFRLITPSTFESNTLYDTPERSLRERGELLRIREYGGVWLLTHKQHPPTDGNDDGDAHYKRRIETETTLSDGAALATIFAQLGLQPVFRYEKWRSEWADASGHLVIDKTPIGMYAELEGEPAWIDASLEKLGVDPATCTTASYGKLFLQWCERTGSTVEHLTFSAIPSDG